MMGTSLLLLVRDQFISMDHVNLCCEADFCRMCAFSESGGCGIGVGGEIGSFGK